jgi:hypothetical protein
VSEKLDKTWRQIGEIVREIEFLQAELMAAGIPCRQPEDFEAHDIVCRMERKARSVLGLADG